MNKAIFLDRDGTINIEKNYMYKIDDFEYLNGVKDALRIFQEKGYLLIIVSNQSGIARGFYTESDLKKLSIWLENDLRSEGIYICDQYYCPHLPDSKILAYSKECDCRKPKIGMFLEAAKKYNIDLGKSIVAGDKERDVAICNYEIGKNTKGFVIYSNIEFDKGNIKYIKGGLLEVAQII